MSLSFTIGSTLKPLIHVKICSSHLLYRYVNHTWRGGSRADTSEGDHSQGCGRFQEVPIGSGCILYTVLKEPHKPTHVPIHFSFHPSYLAFFVFISFRIPVRSDFASVVTCMIPLVLRDGDHAVTAFILMAILVFMSLYQIYSCLSRPWKEFASMMFA